jgi:hypothetical protein
VCPKKDKNRGESEVQKIHSKKSSDFHQSKNGFKAICTSAFGNIFDKNL